MLYSDAIFGRHYAPQLHYNHDILQFQRTPSAIYQQLVDKLKKERSLERRQALYLFPQQFSSLQETLSGFLDKLYHASRYNETAMLRGIYLIVD